MTARIYCDTYAKYNSGSIEGKWFDLEDYVDKDDFIEACQTYHDRNNPEDEDGDVIQSEHEFMFQDHEGIPSGFISESYIDPDFWDYMNYEDHYDGEAKAAYMSLFNEWDELDFKDKFHGHYASDTELAEEYVESSGMLSDMPESLYRYFDYESFGRDLAYDFSENNGFYFRA